MYGFEHMLFKNEQLFFSGKSRPDLMPKDEDIGAIYICTTLFLFLLLCYLIFNLFNGNMTNKGEFLMIIILGIVVFGLGYNAIYKKFFKKKKIVNYEYGITNLRVLIYNKKTKELTEGPLRDYKNIYVINNNYSCGDVVFTKFPNNKGLNDHDDGQAQPIIIGKQTDTLIFEAVEKPQEIKQLAIELRNKLN